MTTLKQLQIDALFRCMTNPNNKDFYIPDLTLDDVKRILTHPDNDPDYIADFWTAYHLAEEWWFNIEKPRLEEEYRQFILEEYKQISELCDSAPCSSPA